MKGKAPLRISAFGIFLFALAVIVLLLWYRSEQTAEAEIGRIRASRDSCALQDPRQLLRVCVSRALL